MASSSLLRLLQPPFVLYAYLQQRFVHCLILCVRRMSSDTPCPNERVESWKNRWDAGMIGFHNTEVHPMLNKHLEKLIPDGKVNKIFFPLCGKAVDMKWLADKGFTVVGVDGVLVALEQFFKEQKLESIVEDGTNVKVYKSQDGRIKLYCCDIMKFTNELEGTFDAVWDRASLVALQREDVFEYVKVIKDLLSPRGRILLEVMEYDLSLMDGINQPTTPPPPYPMYEEEIKMLYEPECTVEFLDRADRLLAGKDIHVAYYLIVRKS